MSKAKVYFTNPSNGDLEKIRTDTKYEVIEVITDHRGNIVSVNCMVEIDD